VNDVSMIARRLIDSLVTPAPVRRREDRVLPPSVRPH
jgi:hypothetical protein